MCLGEIKGKGCQNQFPLSTRPHSSLYSGRTVWRTTSFVGHSSTTLRDFIPPLISPLYYQLDSISFASGPELMMEWGLSIVL